jgi:hypothetical protein
MPKLLYFALLLPLVVAALGGLAYCLLAVVAARKLRTSRRSRCSSRYAALTPI